MKTLHTTKLHWWRARLTGSGDYIHDVEFNGVSAQHPDECVAEDK